MPVNHPAVSVLMPVYNTGVYLREAIASVLCQTFTDFEFLVFNDGSTDDSVAVIRSFGDARIKLFDQHLNTGYVAHLNRGIELATGKYIARMDSDDVCHPQRLEKQVSFMEAHPGVGICGTWFDIIGEPDQVILHPVKDRDTRIRFLHETALGHPTVMMRSEVLQHYSLRYKGELVPAEDYHLWVEASQHCQLANLPEVLLHYRRHPGQISVRKSEDQAQKVSLARQRQLDWLMGEKVSETDLSLFEAVISKQYLRGDDFLGKAATWLEKMKVANEVRKSYDPVALSAVLANYWKNLLLHAPRFNPAMLRAAYAGSMQTSQLLTAQENVVFILKCLLSWEQRGVYRAAKE